MSQPKILSFFPTNQIGGLVSGMLPEKYISAGRVHVWLISIEVFQQSDIRKNDRGSLLLGGSLVVYEFPYHQEMID